MLEEKQTKTIWIYDMACQQENSIEKNRLEKRTNYRQLAFEIGEREDDLDSKLTFCHK